MDLNNKNNKNYQPSPRSSKVTLEVALVNNYVILSLAYHTELTLNFWK